ncbi:hypothetical protein BTO28_03530 [Domibacillus epiphyticus]|uniref:Uncharacterized protein n=1 Tax=Domibacillus epiphyticus TaxID=1714355 RepID=A0A1V2AAM0_9BACI|nr:hypothetical protein BTO28_03530 [Domibacillus epiphyticus]
MRNKTQKNTYEWIAFLKIVRIFRGWLTHKQSKKGGSEAIHNRVTRKGNTTFLINNGSEKT